MKSFLKNSIQLIGVFIIIALSSCATFEPGWNTVEIKESQVDKNQLIARAHSIESTAASAEQVELLIETFKEVLKTDPLNYYALWKIGNYHILMGAAYAEKKKDKKYHYQEAIKYCEKAMATNTTFKTEVLNGKDITEALDKLTIHQIDAMGYWYTARFYYFSECLAPLGRVMNTG